MGALPALPLVVEVEVVGVAGDMCGRSRRRRGGNSCDGCGRAIGCIPMRRGIVLIFAALHVKTHGAIRYTSLRRRRGWCGGSGGGVRRGSVMMLMMMCVAVMRTDDRAAKEGKRRRQRLPARGGQRRGRAITIATDSIG